MNQKFRIAMIGAGSRANSVIYPAFYHLEDVEIAAVCDIDPQRLHATADKYGVSKRYGDTVYSYQDMINEIRPDAVAVIGQPDVMYPIWVWVLEQGYPLFIEKPMALTVASAEEITAACEKKHVTAAIVSQLRFSPDVQCVRSLVQSGEMGQIISANLEMKYFRSDEYYAASNWRGTWKMDGGGALMNQGIHGVDIMSFIMGGVKSVNGQIKTLAKKIEVEDTAVAALEFCNGALGTLTASVATAPGYPRTLTISSTKGTLVLEEQHIQSCDIAGVSLPQQRAQQHNFGSSNPTDIPVEGHVQQITDFIAAVREQRDPFVSLAEGKKAIEIIEGIYTSSRTGKKVFLGEK